MIKRNAMFFVQKVNEFNELTYQSVVLILFSVNLDKKTIKSV